MDRFSQGSCSDFGSFGLLDTDRAIKAIGNSAEGLALGLDWDCYWAWSPDFR